MRYADDLLIFTKSRKSAERTLTNILPYIENKLFLLKVNREKTIVDDAARINLEFSFYQSQGETRVRIHPNLGFLF